jgi:hypothetical protein
MRFRRFRKELMYDGRNWYCPLGACQQVRGVDHLEDVAAKRAADDKESNCAEEDKAADRMLKKQKKADDKLQAAFDKHQQKKQPSALAVTAAEEEKERAQQAKAADQMLKKQKKADKDLQAAFDKDQKALQDAATRQKADDFRGQMEQVVVEEARRAAELIHLPLIHDDVLSACLQDVISQLRAVGSKLGESRLKAEAKLPYSTSEAALEAIEDKYKVGYSGSDVLLKWLAPLAAFDSFFGQPPTVDGMSWHDPFFTGWRRPMPVNSEVT